MRKLFQFKLYSFLSSRWGMTFCVVGLFVTMNAIFQVVRLVMSRETALLAVTNYSDNVVGKSYEHIMCNEPIDIVYTWVNGSDPKHKKTLADYKRSIRDPNMKACNATQTPDKDKCYAEEDTASRFIDNEELRYSLRSIETFAPWVHHVYLVTNGQVPSWLNTEHPKLSVVTHSQIFQNQSHLPTFSSPSIEVHLHRIPGLSKKFIYLNDDVMFGRDVYPDDFYTLNAGQKVFLSWAVPNCAEGCPPNWVGDGYCDLACNVSVCDFDAGDCANYTAPSGGYSNFRVGDVGSGFTDTSQRYKNYCAKGCPDSWIGDKYCDRMCKNLECAFDAGDCGVDDIFGSMHGVQITMDTGLIELPSGLASVYFNLTDIVGNATITDGSHDNAQLVRTATISQKFKIMTLTFHRNVSFQEVMLSITAERTLQSGNKTTIEKSFNISLDTIVLPPEPTTAPEQAGNGTEPSTLLNGTQTSQEQPNAQSQQSANTTVDVVGLEPAHEIPSDVAIEQQIEGGSGMQQGQAQIQPGDSALESFSPMDAQIQDEVVGTPKPDSFTVAPIKTQVETTQATKPPESPESSPSEPPEPSSQAKESAFDLKEQPEVIQHSEDIAQDELRKRSQVHNTLEKHKQSQEQNEGQQKLTDSKKSVLNFASEESLHDVEPEEVGLSQSAHGEITAIDPITDKLQRNNRIDASESDFKSEKTKVLDLTDLVEETKSQPPAQARDILSIPIYDQIDKSPIEASHWTDGRAKKLNMSPSEYKKWWDTMTEKKKNEMLELEESKKEMEAQEDKLRENRNLEKKLAEESSQLFPWEIAERNWVILESKGGGRRLLDDFADSLKFVNKLYTSTFGPAARKVPAHMPHMIDRDVMEELQNKWPDLWNGTASHRLRHPQDMQYAFAYFYYLIHARVEYNLTEVWRTELDKDQDGELSDNELRTLGVHLHGAPLKQSTFKEMKEKLLNTCITLRAADPNYKPPPASSEEEEESESSSSTNKVAHIDCPITLNVVEHDNKTADDIKKVFSKRAKYRHQIEGTDEVAFLMIGNNDTVVQGKLDGIRTKRQRFICLNDNMNHSNPDVPAVVKVLHDLYTALVPLHSSFELPDNVRNAYAYIDDINLAKEATRRHRHYQMAVGVASMIVLVCLVYQCRKYANRADRRVKERRARRLLNSGGIS